MATLDIPIPSKSESSQNISWSWKCQANTDVMSLIHMHAYMCIYTYVCPYIRIYMCIPPRGHLAKSKLWCQAGRGGCCYCIGGRRPGYLLNILQYRGHSPPKQKITWPKTSLVLRWKHPSLYVGIATCVSVWCVLCFFVISVFIFLSFFHLFQGQNQ